MADIPDPHAPRAVGGDVFRSPSLDETLGVIAEAARASVPGFDQVGISVLNRNGSVETRAATGSLVYKLDYLQYKLGEGPCLDVLVDPRVIVAPRLQDDRRWPHYVRAANEMGIRSQLAVGLVAADGGVLGGLNLYSTTVDDIDVGAGAAAEDFAARAAIALAAAKNRHPLNEALHTRNVIGQAVGILMERHRVNEYRAFALLSAAATDAHSTLRMAAQDVVDQLNH